MYQTYRAAPLDLQGFSQTLLSVATSRMLNKSNPALMEKVIHATVDLNAEGKYLWGSFRNKEKYQ